MTKPTNKTRIRQIVETMDFSYDPSLLTPIRQLLFDKSDTFRKNDIYRHEGILNGASCQYVHFENIETKINDTFKRTQQAEFMLRASCEAPEVSDIFQLTVDFASSFWSIHPYDDGNTRTTTALLLLFLKYWGITLSNKAFAQYPWTFRNCLIVAAFGTPQIPPTPYFACRFLEKVYTRDLDFHELSRAYMRKNGAG